MSTICELNISKDVWHRLETLFASNSRSCATCMRGQLNSMHQGSQTCHADLNYAKSWSNLLAAVGKPLDDISFLVSGLNSSFNSFVTSFSFTTREKSLTFNDFWYEWFTHKCLLNWQQTLREDFSTFALYSNKSYQPSKSNKCFSKQKQSPTYRGPSQHKPTPSSSATPTSNSITLATNPSSFPSKNHVPCQICG